MDSINPGWIQSTFDMLTGLFDRVGMCKNICRTMGMVCNPFRETGVKEDKDYTWRMAGEGRTFEEKQW